MLRTTSALRPPGPVRAPYLSGGNAPPEASSPDRLARIELLLESIEKTLAVQFQRIADLQAQLDRAIADRPIPRR